MHKALNYFVNVSAKCYHIWYTFGKAYCQSKKGAIFMTHSADFRFSIPQTVARSALFGYAESIIASRGIDRLRRRAGGRLCTACRGAQLPISEGGSRQRVGPWRGTARRQFFPLIIGEIAQQHHHHRTTAAADQ